MVLERAIDLWLAVWRGLVPFVVLDQYERGVVLRFGKYRRDIGPGWWWLLPLGIEKAISDSVAVSTTTLPPQSLTTKDGHSVVVSLVLTHRVHDIRVLLLEVEGKDQACLDCAAGVLALEISSHGWAEIVHADFLTAVHRSVRKRAFRYGIEVLAAAFSDLQRCKSFRILGVDKPTQRS